MKRLSGLLSVVIFIAGCNVTYEPATYEPPLHENQSYSTLHNSSQAVVLAKTKKVLSQEGYEILHGDILAGVVSTDPKNFKLKPGQASCGTLMSFDYLYDNRTTTEVAFEVIVDAATLTIRSNIQGKYRASLLDEETTLTCVSYGVIEQNLANKILILAGSEQG